VPKKIKVLSETTSGHKMQLRSYLAELMLIRQYGLSSLSPYFWRHKFWRGLYTKEVRAISKFLKSYGPRAVVEVASNPFITTFTNYAELEFFLQKESAKDYRLAQPKDTSIIKNETDEVQDLREPRFFVKKKGLFEKLNEFEK
jgi:hypothetical protein